MPKKNENNKNYSDLDKLGCKYFFGETIYLVANK